jgi:hypothetical protein
LKDAEGVRVLRDLTLIVGAGGGEKSWRSLFFVSPMLSTAIDLLVRAEDAAERRRSPG